MEYKKDKEKCWFFTITEKIVKYLARLNKQKTRSLKLLKTGEKGDITDTLNLQKILSE